MIPYPSLYLPALLRGAAHWQEPAYSQGLAIAQCERLLSKAKKMTLEAQDFDTGLFRQFSYSSASPPIAAATFLVDVGESSGDMCLRADPVCVMPDRDQLVMLGNRHLGIRADEAQQLAAEFNRLFADDGLRLIAPTTQRWYLLCERPRPIVTHALSAVMARDIHQHLPGGAEAIWWHGVLNEAQMLFYASPVNEARRQRGEPEINSLWFWGEGTLPKPPHSPWQAVWANDVLSQGLARLAGVPQHTLPATAEDWLEQSATGGEQLIVFDSLHEAALSGDIVQWREQLEGLEEYWLSPLLKALEGGHLAGINIVTDSATFSLSRRQLRRWWCRRRPFASFAC